tara:strand:- start:1310 stop:2377 length:1068 start_codon:yes stop_codon:yes gene_type:complete
MGKGGAQATTQTVKQDVPDWAKPYYTDILGKSKSLSEEAYSPYGAQRVAGESADLGTSQQMVRGFAGQPIVGFGEAQGTLGGLGDLAGLLGQQQPGQFSATQGQEFGFDPTRQFGGAEVQQYMDPYMQTVVGRQQDDAFQQFQRMQAGRDAQAVQAGAFGGSRQAVQQGMAEEALGRQLGDIQATGSQRAFEQAQMQFERDRAASMTTEQRQAAEAARVQGIDVGEQARVQGATADEAMRQREFQLQNMGFSADMAREVANLGERARAGDIQAAQLLEAQGLGQMARDQAGLDVAYQDFLRQQQFPSQQLGTYSNILRGLPVGDAGTQTTTQPYNPLQQALGAGISAVGLYKGMQ